MSDDAGPDGLYGLGTVFTDPTVRVRPRAVGGGTSDMRLTLTINGNEVTTWRIVKYGNLETDDGVCGIVFIPRELTEEEDLADVEEWLRKQRARQRGNKSKPA